MTLWQTIQQAVWRHAVYPIFPFFQKRLLFMHEKGRQRYHLGWLAEGKTLEGFKRHLALQGFGNHFVAWRDQGQVLSWRKLESFGWQYHVRVFEDGEIRAHYERSPESAPIRHFREIGEESRSKEFNAFLGDFLSKKKYISHLAIDESMSMPHPQFTWRDALAFEAARS